MALIKIQQDGSFESLSAVDYAAKVETLTARIAANRAELAELKKILPTLRTISSLKLRAQGQPSAKSAPIKKKIADLREKHGLSPRTQAGPTSAKIKSLTAAIAKDKEALTAAKAKAKTSAKSAAKSVMKQPVTKKPTEKQAPAVKTVKARGSKITIDINKTAGNKVVKNTTKISKTSLKDKPVAALHKKDNVKSPAITNVLSKIKAIKEDIAKTKVASKRQHMEKELAALRSQLRVLRKGQSAKNQAAVTKAKPSGNMGGAKKVTTKQKGMGDAKTTPLDIKDQRAKVSDLRIKVAKEKDPTKKAALEKRYASAVSKMKKMKLVK